MKNIDPDLSYRISRICQGNYEHFFREIRKWLFLKSGVPVSITRYSGEKISYYGIAFEGSPRMVFWESFISEYLLQLTEETLKCLAKEARSASDSVELYVECGISCIELIHNKVYQEVVRVNNLLVVSPEMRVTIESTQTHYSYVDDHLKKIVRSYKDDSNMTALVKLLNINVNFYFLSFTIPLGDWLEKRSKKRV